MNPSPFIRYPSSLEQWWLARARHAFKAGDDSTALKRAEPFIRQQSDTFTKERETDLTQAYGSEKHIAAYGLYFFPQTYTRTSFVLTELLARQGIPKPETNTPLRILDLGAGSGAAGISALDTLSDVQPAMHLTLVDRDATALDAAQHLLRHRKFRRDIRFQTCRSPITDYRPQEPVDLILLSFSLSEACRNDLDAATGLAQSLLKHLSPQGILVLIEPALKTSSVLLESLRDRLLDEKSASVVAPCLHQKSCPMLAAGTRTWCHEVRSWPLPRSVQVLNDRLKRTVYDLKFSFLALSPQQAQDEKGSATTFRLTSPIAKTRGRYQFTGCAADGHLNEYDLLARTVDEESRHHLQDFGRGDIVTCSELKKLGSATSYRIPAPGELAHAPSRPDS